MAITTITVSTEMKNRLEARKVHPRASYEEVIEELLSNQKKKVGP